MRRRLGGRFLFLSSARALGSVAPWRLPDLTRNAVDVLPEGGLEAKLQLGRPLRVKLGIDVTSPDIHIGRAIPLQRMRAFQDEGHVGVLIIGDYTTRIGDPSGRSAERPILSDEEIDANAKTYLEQAMVVLDRDRTEVRYNGEWLSKLSYAEVVRLARTITVARMLERDDFAKRMAAQQPISVSELLYPLMQAYDSVAVEADVELGGTDQLYNLLAGREVMAHYGLEPQVVADDAAPALVGRREDELVGRQQHPADRAARRDVRPDDADPRRAAAGLVAARRRAGRRRPAIRWRRSSRSPARSSRARTARRRPTAAEAHFTRVVRQREAPDEIAEVALPDGDPVHLPALLVASLGVGVDLGGAAPDRAGRREARREPVGELDVAARAARRGAAAGREAAVRPARLRSELERLLPSGPVRAIVPRLSSGQW